MGRLIIFALIALLSGCANTARYQASDWYYGGYSEKPLEGGSYQITYSGSNTDLVTTQIFWIYRAAELATKNGYKRLEVVSAFPAEYHSPRFEDAAFKVPCPVFNIECFSGTRSSYYFISGVVIFDNKSGDYVPLKSYDADELRRKLKPIIENTSCNTTFASHLCPFDMSVLLPETKGKNT